MQIGSNINVAAGTISLNAASITGALTYTPLNQTLNNTQIFVGNGSNVATGVAMSGDTTLANTGAVTITNNAVTTAKINNLAVTDAKILAEIAHVTLYILRHNYTNTVHLDMVNEVYQKNILPNMNIIFNGIKNKKILGYNYGKGYNYGYGYGGIGYYSDHSEKNSLFKKRKKKH